MKPFARWIVVAVLMLSAAAEAASPVRIGVLAFLGKPEAVLQWQPTVTYLSKEIPTHRFELVPMDYAELNTAVKNAQVDFVVTNPEHYVVLSNEYQLSPLVTLSTQVNGQFLSQLGSVIFARGDDKRIETLSDIRGKRVAGVGEYSLGGYLIAAEHIRQQQIDLHSPDVAEFVFTGVPHARVVERVLSGQSDVGIIRTGVLEFMAQKGQLDLTQVKVLNPQRVTHFPQALSTDLYPEWPWATMPHTHPTLAKAVTLALLRIQPDSAAARAGLYGGFTHPANYAPVDALMRRLKVYPEVQAPPLWRVVWLQYENQIKAFAMVFLVVSLVLSVYFWRSNRRLLELTRLYSRAQDGLRVTSTAFESQIGLIVTDDLTHVVRVNQAFAEILGYDEGDLLYKPTFGLRGLANEHGTLTRIWAELQASGRWQGELLCRHKKGFDLPCMVTITSVLSETTDKAGFVGSFVDISKQKEAHAEIRQLAFFDPLTELPNRRLFMSRLSTELNDSRRTHCLGALLFIDLDHFKVLNDGLGHTVGDQLLQQLARRLGRVLAPHDMAARLGGDEFVVMLTHLDADKRRAMAVAIAMAETLREAILEPYRLNTDADSTGDSDIMPYTCSASIGVALFGMEPERVVEVLKRADVAMYLAKQAGRDTVRPFDPEAHQQLQAKLALTVELRSALSEQHFEVYYQLQADTTGHPIGAECLLRWKHPRRGFVPPSDFIPIAEETGLIIKIGERVLNTACEALTRWSGMEGLKNLSLSVNVSPRQFIESNFIARVEKILQRTGAPANKLVLEITEGIVLNNAEQVIERMQRLRTFGISFSIDDFGTGYSSLSYMHKLPLKEVKIDQSFIQDITYNPNSDAVVRSIVALANSIGLHVVSEGVETQTQLALLDSIGCSRLQGYLIAKPMPLAEFETVATHAFQVTAASLPLSAL